MNLLKHSSVVVLLLAILASCAIFSEQRPLKSKKVIRDGREMLYGKISLEQLFYDYPDWKTEYASYVPQNEIIAKLKQIEPRGRVLIFLGTWCPDSEREVPRFFKILDAAGLSSKLPVEMWAVDRKKSLPNELPQKYHIEYVPTFIFEINNREIGRIIESPEALYLEEDVLNILSGK
ncbi:thioredoxin family protein [Caldithrix abyssi DSM 13497]|uniref:Thioredoxin n=1 Tax=Caldithrix abyssi DSM 13497 TaxID=880073 RepID=H1XNL5_CALAY|nr:thioredoxin family protein [Caldithrix abyssi]APF19350.1 Thioredoxin [Caldithrix abyssi DSM 13497]EHO43253.1 thioredoxin family protein [Caldithrix abyssi DSM 13497]